MSRGCWNVLAPALLILVCFAAAPPVRASGRAECRSAPSKFLGHPVSYCVFLPPSYDLANTRAYPVLYFLHGLGENEQVLLNSGGMNLIEDLREQKQLGEFLIVAPDGGRSFYVNSCDGRVRYEDFFIREFIPYIEAHYRIRAARRYRGISGVSMGGYGALRLAFRYPELFGSASAHSAALLEKLPRAKASDSQIAFFSQILGAAFGSPIDTVCWERESPFTLVRNARRPAGLKIYFDCGAEDDFGFDAGARQFHDLLVSRRIPHEFHLYPGGHGWSYVTQHLAASLESHSRAFALAPSAASPASR